MGLFESVSAGVEFLMKGGPVVLLLMAASMFTVAIAIERGMFFSKSDAGRDFAKKFYSHMIEGDSEKARDLAKSTKGLLPKLITDAFGKVGTWEPKRVEGFLEVQSGIILSKFRKKLYYLNVIVTMAPLLGLLGTISGMISAFSVFNLDEGQASAITGGVGEALVATAIGLCVAIIALAVHAYFSQRVENIVSDMEECLSFIETEAYTASGAMEGKSHETA